MEAAYVTIMNGTFRANVKSSRMDSRVGIGPSLGPTVLQINLPTEYMNLSMHLPTEYMNLSMHDDSNRPTSL
jgi:hypothetical protein